MLKNGEEKKGNISVRTSRNNIVLGIHGMGKINARSHPIIS
jgi:hypothetical protein